MAQVSVSLGKVAQLVDAELHGDSNCSIQAVATLAQANSGQISFIDSSKYLAALKATKASAVLLPEKFKGSCPTNALIVANPKLALAKVLNLINPPKQPEAVTHPTAVVGNNCSIGSQVAIGANSVIGDDVVIGDGAIIGPGVVIGDCVKIGKNCVLEANVSLYYGITLGEGVIVHSGAVIGADGFGYEQDAGKWVKLPQVGSVRIGNQVEIGANTTIDRGAIEDTVIGDGVKLDNQIMIAHNVNIGESTVIAACTGIAGSAKIGRNCIIAGAAAVSDNVTVVDNVIVSGMSMVTKSLLEPGIYSSGTGILPNRVWQKSAIRFKQLDEMYQRIKKLEKENDN